MDDTESTPLTEQALKILADASDGDGLPMETAIEELQAAEFTRADAEDILQQLLLEGECYEVDERIFVTSTTD